MQSTGSHPTSALKRSPSFDLGPFSDMPGYCTMQILVDVGSSCWKFNSWGQYSTTSIGLGRCADDFFSLSLVGICLSGITCTILEAAVLAENCGECCMCRPSAGIENLLPNVACGASPMQNSRVSCVPCSSYIREPEPQLCV